MTTTTRTQQQQYRNKKKTGASLGGLLLWFDLGSSFGELSRSNLEILGALAEGNSLKGLNKKSWLLSMEGLNITCGFHGLLGCIRVLAFTRLNHLRRLAFLGWLLKNSYFQNSSRYSSLGLLRSIPNLRVGGGSFPNGRGVVYVLHLPQVE